MGVGCCRYEQHVDDNLDVAVPRKPHAESARFPCEADVLLPVLLPVTPTSGSADDPTCDLRPPDGRNVGIAAAAPLAGENATTSTATAMPSKDNDIPRSNCGSNAMLSHDVDSPATCGHGDGYGAQEDDEITIVHQAADACDCGRLLLAQSILGKARLKHCSKLVKNSGRNLQALAQLPERIERVERVLKACVPPSGDTWKKMENEHCTVWRRWECNTLHVIFRWEAIGSLLQHIASLRDPDAAESLWAGLCWDMKTVHAEGATLARWLQTVPVLGRGSEILVERVLCDCLDSELPCWVLTERSPDVEDVQNFSGKWGPFDIVSRPKGYTRAASGDGGRIIEPISPEKCRISMAMNVQVPPALAWLVTDSLIAWAMNQGAPFMLASWNNIINNWDSSEYGQRIKRDASFYDPVRERILAYLESQQPR